LKALTHFFRASTAAVETSSSRPFALIRTFVETGDERCPLAGLWLRLVESNSPTDDPELTKPAMAAPLPWRAFHLRFTAVQYSTAW
jgi:hypothetical protein